MSLGPNGIVSLSVILLYSIIHQEKQLLHWISCACLKRVITAHWLWIFAPKRKGWGGSLDLHLRFQQWILPTICMLFYSNWTWPLVCKILAYIDWESLTEGDFIYAAMGKPSDMLIQTFQCSCWGAHMLLLIPLTHMQVNLINSTKPMDRLW